MRIHCSKPARTLFEGPSRYGVVDPEVKIKLNAVHHVAIIARDYEISKAFYCDVLGLELVSEHYRADRDSWMGKVTLHGHYIIELFSFPDPPARVSGPEATGLRHLAFVVDDVPAARNDLLARGVACEELRVDPYTDKRFFFFADPDGLPLEIYEA